MFQGLNREFEFLKGAGQTLRVISSLALWIFSMPAAAFDSQELITAQPICVSVQGGECRLLLDYDAFSVTSSDTGSTIELRQADSSSVNHQSLNANLLLKVTQGELTSDEAAEIELEIAERLDASYQLPSSPESLKLQLGFTRDVEIAPADLVELIKVHLQMSLGFSPKTAAYLIGQLNFHSPELAQNQDLNLLTNSAATSSLTPILEPIFIPNHN